MNDYSSIIKACQFLLNEYPDAQFLRDYLDNRISKKSQELFQFGYFPDSKSIDLLLSLVSEQELSNNKLIYSKEINDAFSHRKLYFPYFESHPLIMSYKDVYGNDVALVARSLLSDEERHGLHISKYKNTIFEKGHHLFGLFQAKESILEKDHVYIVEGQFDVIKAMEKGITNIVALGNCNMTLEQLALILRYTENIYLLLDNDAAGNVGREKIIKKYKPYANFKNYYIPYQYKDIDELLSDINSNVLDRFENAIGK